MDELTARREHASPSESPYLWGVLLFFLTTIVGLYYAKWMPYFHRALTAAVPPAVGWTAAWSYTVAYAGAVWQALVVGLLVGSGIQALLPRAWLTRFLGRAGFTTTALAGAVSIPSMM